MGPQTVLRRSSSRGGNATPSGRAPLTPEPWTATIPAAAEEDSSTRRKGAEPCGSIRRVLDGLLRFGHRPEAPPERALLGGFGTAPPGFQDAASIDLVALLRSTARTHYVRCASMSAAIINTIGVSLVALGSVLVAYEVVQRFKGERYEVKTVPIIQDEKAMPFGGPIFGEIVGSVSTQAEDTAAYKAWERRRNIVMSIGLGLILGGSGFQIWASWA